MNDSYDNQIPPPDIQALPPIAGSAEPDAGFRVVVPVRRPVWKYVVAAVGFGILYLVMLLAGGDITNFALAGLQAFPFAILAVMAYAARPGNDMAGFTIAYWVVLIGALALFVLVFTGMVLSIPSPSGASLAPTEIVGWIGVAIGGVVLSVAIGFACFLPAVRQRAAEFIDIDPFSFVHATALATTVGIGLMFMVPLLVVQEPPILSLLRWDKFPDLPADENLRTTVYTLFWSVPASFIAVGYPQKRAFREARERLGLLWPGWLQLLGVVIAIAVLLVTMTYLELGVNWLWTRLGWSVTDADAISELFSFGAGPVAAVLVGFAAGLGEELVFRGVLQPRLGIVLPALMFTSVHAFQYNFDALIQVLLLGLAFGLIRKRTNTTTCVLIHAGYDCVLFFWLYLYGSVGTQ